MPVLSLQCPLNCQGMRMFGDTLGTICVFLDFDTPQYLAKCLSPNAKRFSLMEFICMWSNFKIHLHHILFYIITIHLSNFLYCFCISFYTCNDKHYFWRCRQNVDPPPHPFAVMLKRRPCRLCRLCGLSFFLLVP